MIVTEREREAETQAEGEAGSMHREPDVGLDPGTPGSGPEPKADRCSTTEPPMLPPSPLFVKLLSKSVKGPHYFLFFMK